MKRSLRSWLLLALMTAALPLAGCTKTLNDSSKPEDEPAPQVSEAPKPAETASVGDASQPAEPQSTETPPLPTKGPLANFGPPSGTAVGERALQLRDEILRLEVSIADNAAAFREQRSNGTTSALQYHSLISAITARLQNGTTRGNPILLRQWKEAEVSLNDIIQALGEMNKLSTAIASDSSRVDYFRDSIQAALQLAGAVDEDHEQLAKLREAVAELGTQSADLGNEITNDIERQTGYLTTERANLQDLAFAINKGKLSPVMPMPQATPMATPAPAQLPPPASSPALAVESSAIPATALPTPSPAPEAAPVPVMPTPQTAAAQTAAHLPDSPGRLMMLIRFTKPDVAYQQDLERALKTVLARESNPHFNVVSIAPMKGKIKAAQNNADKIRQALLGSGISPERITLGTAQLPATQTPEVQIYVR